MFTIHGLPPAPRMNWAMRSSSTGSGTEPSARIASWNGRWSNFAPELLLGFPAMAADLDFAQLVRERLPRPRDVAFDLGRDLVLGQRRTRAQILHRLLARPAELVDARVDDETARAPHLVRQPPEVLVRRFVDAHHGAEPLGVQPPAFAVTGERRRRGGTADAPVLRARAPPGSCGRACTRAASATPVCRADAPAGCTCSSGTTRARRDRRCRSAPARPAPAGCRAGAAAGTRSSRRASSRPSSRHTPSTTAARAASWRRTAGSVRRKVKNSAIVPVKPACCFVASISAWMRATSFRPMSWICCAVRSSVVNFSIIACRTRRRPASSRRRAWCCALGRYSSRIMASSLTVRGRHGRRESR